MEKEEKKPIGKKVKFFVARHLMVVSFITFAVMLLLGYILLFAPELKRIRAMNVARSLEEERTGKARYLSSLEELMTKYSKLDESQIESLKIMIPRSDEIPTLLAMFEVATRNSDVSLTSIAFSRAELDGAVAEIKGLEAVNISLSITNASYSRFKLFLEQLQTNLRLFDIRNIDLNPTGSAYNLSIRAYVRKVGKP